MGSDSKNAVIATIKECRTELAGVADVATSVLLDDSVASKIPVVSWAVAAHEVVGAFRKARLRKNVGVFLSRVMEAPTADLGALTDRLRADDAFAEEFADVTLSVLLEAARPVKAEVLGNLTVALAERQITRDTYSELALIVEAASIPSLHALEHYFDQSYPQQTPKEEPLLLSMGVARRYGNAFLVSEEGQRLYEIGFGKQIKRPAASNSAAAADTTAERPKER